VYYSAEHSALRLIVLDSTVPGHDSGALDSEQLGWLDAELCAGPDEVTVLPGTTRRSSPGCPHGTRSARALRPSGAAEVVAPNPQVSRILAGHVHRAITSELAGRIVESCPSTYIQGLVRFGATELEPSDEAAGFLVHAVRGAQAISYVLPVTLEAAGEPAA
jgi:3',5'-cyclic AMP phosphodiesterase CpdA